MAKSDNGGWGRVEKETPKQTSERIVAQMRKNAKDANKTKK